MHLTEVIALRSVPAAGLIIECTRRCPLSCAHCSTNSSMSVAQHSSKPAVTFVETFTRDCRPEVVALTGGEPLLRPDMVEAIGEAAHRAGSSVHLLTGMYFALSKTVPSPIFRALEQVDHVSASLDAFHEREIPRQRVFAVMAEILARGRDISFQIVGEDPSDPFLHAMVADVRRHFGDRVPMLVSSVRPEGRAQSWLDRTGGATPVDISPCAMAAWPVVRDTGDIVACCNQTVVDGRAVPHLMVGHAATATWSAVRDLCLNRPSLKALRCGGPRLVADLVAAGAGASYCGTCHALGEQNDLESRLTAALNPVALDLMDRMVAGTRHELGAVAFAQGLAMPEYAELVSLGQTG